MVLTQPKASYCWPLTLGAGVLCWAGFAVGSPSANLSRPSFPHVGWGLGFPPGHSLGFGVILRPDSLKFVQVVGTQDGPVPRQVVKVVHDDGNKKIQHLWGPQGPRGGQGERDTSKHIYTEAQRERGREIKTGKGSQRKRWGETEERHALTEGARKQRYGEMEMGRETDRDSDQD